MKASSMKQLCIEEFRLLERSVRPFAADIFGMVNQLIKQGSTFAFPKK